MDRSTLSKSLPNSGMSLQLHHPSTEGSVPRIATYHYDLPRSSSNTDVSSYPGVTTRLGRLQLTAVEDKNLPPALRSVDSHTTPVSHGKTSKRRILYFLLRVRPTTHWTSISWTLDRFYTVPGSAREKGRVGGGRRGRKRRERGEREPHRGGARMRRRGRAAPGARGRGGREREPQPGC
eukprot:1516736-Rhodomonas_salina.1